MPQQQPVYQRAAAGRSLHDLVGNRGGHLTILRTMERARRPAARKAEMAWERDPLPTDNG